MSDCRFLDLFAVAANNEVEALLRVTQSIRIRHPELGPDDDPLVYATTQERASVARIRARIEGRLQATQMPGRFQSSVFSQATIRTMVQKSDGTFSKGRVMKSTVTVTSGPAYELEALRFICPCGFVAEVRLAPHYPESLPVTARNVRRRHFEKSARCSNTSAPCGPEPWLPASASKAWSQTRRTVSRSHYEPFSERTRYLMVKKTRLKVRIPCGYSKKVSKLKTWVQAHTKKRRTRKK